MDNIEAKTGWMKLWTPSGVQVTLPVPTHSPGSPDINYGMAFAAVQNAITAGFLVDAPGLESGETVKQVGYVVRRSKDGRNGEVSVIDLYEASDGMNFSFLSVYLNTPEDVTAFQRASGMIVMSIPLYIGDNKIERGKKRELDRLVTRVPRPFGVVYAANPKFNKTEADAAKLAGKPYKYPSRKFVRWSDQPATTTQTKDGTSSSGDVHPELQPLAASLAASPDLAAFNNLFGFYRKFPVGNPLRVVAWQMVNNYAASQGWKYSADHSAFVTT